MSNLLGSLLLKPVVEQNQPQDYAALAQAKGAAAGMLFVQTFSKMAHLVGISKNLLCMHIIYHYALFGDDYKPYTCNPSLA